MNQNFAFVQNFLATTGARPHIYPRDIQLVHNPGSGDFDRPKRQAKMNAIPPRFEGDASVERWGGRFLPSASRLHENPRYEALASHLSPGAWEKLEELEMTNIRRGARTTGAEPLDTINNWTPALLLLLLVFMAWQQWRLTNAVLKKN